MTPPRSHAPRGNARPAALRPVSLREAGRDAERRQRAFPRGAWERGGASPLRKQGDDTNSVFCSRSHAPRGNARPAALRPVSLREAGRDAERRQRAFPRGAWERGGASPQRKQGDDTNSVFCSRSHAPRGNARPAALRRVSLREAGRDAERRQRAFPRGAWERGGASPLRKQGDDTNSVFCSRSHAPRGNARPADLRPVSLREAGRDAERRQRAFPRGAWERGGASPLRKQGDDTNSVFCSRSHAPRGNARPADLRPVSLREAGRDAERRQRAFPRGAWERGGASPLRKQGDDTNSVFCSRSHAPRGNARPADLRPVSLREAGRDAERRQRAFPRGAWERGGASPLRKQGDDTNSVFCSRSHAPRGNARPADLRPVSLREAGRDAERRQRAFPRGAWEREPPRSSARSTFSSLFPPFSSTILFSFPRSAWERTPGRFAARLSAGGWPRRGASPTRVPTRSVGTRTTQK